jgi:tocopherol O-methyltransferase
MHCGYVEPAHRSHAASLLAMNAVMADEVGVRPGDRVLDAGCGVGGTAVWLAAARGARVVGVNIVPSQLARAARRAALRRRRTTEFVEANLMDTGLAPASFDVAWLQESSCHVPDKVAMLGEMRRLLQPAGRMAIADFLVVPGVEEREDFRTWVSSWGLALASEDAWREFLARTGFTNVRVQDVTGPVAQSVERLYRRATRADGLVRLLEAIGARNETQVRNVRGGRAMWSALQAGAFRYGILTATRDEARVMRIRPVGLVAVRAPARRSCRSRPRCAGPPDPTCAARAAGTSVAPMDRAPGCPAPPRRRA